MVLSPSYHSSQILAEMGGGGGGGGGGGHRNGCKQKHE